MTTICRNCQKEKPTSEFYKDASVRAGIKLDCKTCYSQKSKEQEKSYKPRRRELHRGYLRSIPCRREKRNAESAEWRDRNRDRISDYNKRKWWSVSDSKRRELWIKSHYGMTIEDERKMLEAQDYRCPMCLTALTRKNLAIDHDHACCPSEKRSSCGRCVRGILCKKCNSAIGLFKDNTNVLRRAVAYLDRFTKAAPAENFSEPTGMSGLQASLAGPYPYLPSSDTPASFSIAMVPA